MNDLTEGKVTNAFYLIDDLRYEEPKGMQSLNQDEVYIVYYDKKKKRNVGKWVKSTEILTFINNKR